MRILKERKITLHGAHIFHLGAPLVFLLASAYASDRISRETFLDTLNTLVQRAGSRRSYLQKLRDLVARTLPDADLEKIPLLADISDNWTIAGLFSGITDPSDFELLQDPKKGGEFFKRHFGTIPIKTADGTTAYPFLEWDPRDMLLDTRGTYLAQDFQTQIKPACAFLERGLQSGLYDAPMHIRLRLAAASLKDGHHSDVVGPFTSTEDMKQALADIFHIVEPDYKPQGSEDYENFVFKEPADPPPKTTIPRRTGGGRVAKDANPTADRQTGHDELVRDVQWVASNVLKRAGVKDDVEIPTQRIATQLGFCASGRMKGNERDGNGKTRPPSCVIV